jgi:hypothetical protein
VNHKEAIDYIEELSHKKTEELRLTDIFNIHSILLQGIDPKNAGKSGPHNHQIPDSLLNPAPPA